MADTAHPHLAHLAAFKINGVVAFCGTPADVRDQCLSQAHALAEIFADAVDHDPASQKGEINSQLLRSALQGIASLVALADFASNGDWSR